MSYERTFLRPAGTRPPPRPRSGSSTDRQAVRRMLEELQATHTDVAASMAAAQGFSELTISGLLGHAPRGVTQRYVHLDTALVIAADQVAGEIARLLDGGELRSVREIKQARTLAALRAVA